jgi:hypothetical protein
MVGTTGPMPFGRGESHRRCSFCGRRDEAVEHLVRARGVYICDRCVAQAHGAIASASPGQRLLRIRPAAARVPDRDAAEQAIERAFETAFTSEVPVAERCAAIERGANLTSVMQELSDRYGPARDVDASVEYVRFLSEDEAEVHFVLLLSQFGPSGLARTGHAVRVGEEWKVSRDTWCGLVAMVGVECPPPED